jgi:hypothetical protein
VNYNNVVLQGLMLLKWSKVVTMFVMMVYAGGEWSFSHPGCFTSHVKSTWYPLNRSLTGPQNKSGQFGEEKNLLSLPGIEAWFFSCPVCSLNTILTMLSWLCYNVCACNNNIFVVVLHDLATVPLGSWKICYSKFRTNLMLFCLSEFFVSKWNMA